MEPADRDKLRAMIEQQIPTVEQEIERLKEHCKPVAPDNAIGRLTRMEAINAKSINEANLRSAKARLNKLHTALSKLDDPQFGICSECGEEIPAARLLARPESTRCVLCAA